jgi:cytochrome c-type biogenesis protein
MDATVGGALLAGLVSFITPCVLPIVPPYLAYIAGISYEDLRQGKEGTAGRIVFHALMFVLGFSTVFVLLGATANVIGQALVTYFDILAIVAGALILLLGVHFLGIFRIGILQRDMRFDVSRKPAGVLGAYIMGLAFAFGWTPCVGPVLAAILFVAGTEDTAVRGMLLLGAYAVGMGVPFLLTALFAVRFIALFGRIRGHMHRVEQAMGVMLVATGVLFMSGQMSSIANWLLETFPIFQQIG